MLFALTRAMAVAAGRPPLEIAQSDYEQARLLLTGETVRERQDAVLDAGPPLQEKAQGLADWENEGGRLGSASDQSEVALRRTGTVAG